MRKFKAYFQQDNHEIRSFFNLKKVFLLNINEIKNKKTLDINHHHYR
jgi:hypothetical protein